MSAATIPEVEAVEAVAASMEPAPDAQTFYRRRPPETIFSPDQQKVFDKAFTKRMAKERAESAALRKDLLDTLEVTHELLGICRDRISVADQRAIRSELNNIRLAYGGTKQWPKK